MLSERDSTPGARRNDSTGVVELDGRVGCGGDGGHGVDGGRRDGPLPGDEQHHRDRHRERGDDDQRVARPACHAIRGRSAAEAVAPTEVGVAGRGGRAR